MAKYLVSVMDEFSGREIVVGIYEAIEDEQKAKETAVSNLASLDIEQLTAYELK